MNTIHHPSGITVEIVGIEANSDGQSCHQYDVCGSLVEEDVVLRLRKVQILNSLGRERLQLQRTTYQMVLTNVVLDSDNVTLSPTPRHLMVLWHKRQMFIMVLGAKVQSSKRNGDTTVVVVLRHLSRIFRHRYNTPVRPPTLSWQKLQKEMKRMKQKKCQDKIK